MNADLNTAQYETLTKSEIDQLIVEGRVVEVIEHHLKLVADLAWKYHNKYIIDDLIGEGVRGLNLALDHYDPSFKNSFATYARWWIRREMSAFCRKVTKHSHLSLNMTYSDSENEIMDQVEATHDLTEVPGETTDNDVSELQRAINTVLTKKEKYVIEQFYGLKGKGDKVYYESLTKRGPTKGMTRAGVRAIEKRALKKLKEAIA